MYGVELNVYQMVCVLNLWYRGASVGRKLSSRDVCVCVSVRLSTFFRPDIMSTTFFKDMDIIKGAEQNQEHTERRLIGISNDMHTKTRARCVTGCVYRLIGMVGCYFNKILCVFKSSRL